MVKDEKKAKRFLSAHGWTFTKGFAFDTNGMNPNGYDEIFFSGETAEKAAEDYIRKAEYWVYEPSDGEQIEEDIWDAVDYTEDECGASFEDFK